MKRIRTRYQGFVFSFKTRKLCEWFTPETCYLWIFINAVIFLTFNIPLYQAKIEKQT